MQENKLFPGRKKYTGPTTGVFGLLHHEELCEQSHDVNERIAYVKEYKPKNEVAIRLYNMIYLGDCPAAVGHEAARKLFEDTCATAWKLYEDTCATAWKLCDETRAPAWKLFEDTCATLDVEILAYIKLHIPDCAWNGKTLVF
jgi:hypothetical protein